MSTLQNSHNMSYYTCACNKIGHGATAFYNNCNCVVLATCTVGCNHMHMAHIVANLGGLSSWGGLTAVPAAAFVAGQGPQPECTLLREGTTR